MSGQLCYCAAAQHQACSPLSLFGYLLRGHTLHEGAIFQANIAQRFLADLPSDARPFDVYRRLRRLSSAPFAAFLKCGADRAVISAQHS